jgi:hypothetical protein
VHLGGAGSFEVFDVEVVELAGFEGLGAGVGRKATAKLLLRSFGRNGRIEKALLDLFRSADFPAIARKDDLVD